MKINDFKLERYFAKYEFNVPYILCASDCESFALKELLSQKELAELLSVRLGYTESQGNPTLRKEVAKMFTKITADNIVICTPQEGIFITMNALLQAGDHIIVQYPCYQSLYEIAKSIGCDVYVWKPTENGKEWQWSIETLKETINAKTKLIVINSPHNPTGHLFSKEEYQAIMDIARQKGCYVFSDEMYRMLEYNKDDRLPIGADFYEKCISLSGLSKSFGLPGLRIGWLALQEKELLQKIASFKDYTTICSSALSEYVALYALRKKETLIKRNLSIIKENMKELEMFFAKYVDHFEWIQPKAGPIALVKLKTSGAAAFCEAVIKKAGVMLLPSTMYEYGDHYFRIGFGRKNMPEAIAKVEEYLEKVRKRNN